MKKADLVNEVFLEHKTKKRWIDKSTHPCFMLYARALAVAGGNDIDYWSWSCFKEFDSENVEVVKLITICWLDVQGKFEISQIPPQLDYEIVFVAKLKNGGFGWERTNTLKLSLPNGQVHERRVSLLEEPRGEWIEIGVGSFRRQEGESGELSFNFTNIHGHWKGGIVFKGAIIRPKN